MGRNGTLAPWARITGAGVLAALALLNLAWIVRDFRKAAEVVDVWWMWSGVLFRAQDGVWATSFLEPTLLVLYAVCCALVAARSSAAPGILAASGTLTVLLRLPGVWNLNAGWVQGGVTDGLRAKALWSVTAMLLLGATLVATALLGRRRAGASEAPPPARPSPFGAVVALVLLVAAAVAVGGRELDVLRGEGRELYIHHLTGDRVLVTLLAVPSGWYDWVLVGLSLAAAATLLVRGRYARPLGMTLSGPLMAAGAFSVASSVKLGFFRHVGALPLRDRLLLGLSVFEIVAGLGVLLALAPHAPERPAAAADPAPDASART